MKKYIHLLAAVAVMTVAVAQVQAGLLVKPLLAMSRMSTKTIAKSTVALAAFCASYYHLRVPLKVDSSLDKLNVLTFTPAFQALGQAKNIDTVCKALQKGRGFENEGSSIRIKDNFFNLSGKIPSDSSGTIVIYVSGYAGMSGNARYKYAGAGAHAAYNYIKAGLIGNSSCITFDGQVNDRRSFNFGQKLDQDCLDTVYKTTVEQNPNAKVVIMGSCKGATTILNYLSQKTDARDTNARDTNARDTNTFRNVKAVVLESPSVSFEVLIEHVADKYLKPYGLQGALPYLFKGIFPGYSWGKKSTIVENAHKFPRHIPVFIGSLSHDKVASPEGINTIFKSLIDKQINVERFDCSDMRLKHGHLAKDPGYKSAVISFLRNKGCFL